MKIRIIGSVGSGKTTLAKKLSDVEGISFFETDRIVWKREQTEVRRTESEKRELLKQIICQPDWIIEGVHIESWAMESFTQADVVIFLDIPKHQIHYQLIKRQIKQLLRIDSAHYPIRKKCSSKCFTGITYLIAKPSQLSKIKEWKNHKNGLLSRKKVKSKKSCKLYRDVI